MFARVMNIELVIGDNVCNRIIIYRSWSHIHYDFETFITIFGLKFLDKMIKKKTGLLLLVILILKARLGVKVA